MQKRLIVIPFDQAFIDEDRDRFLFERIWENELPGVLNRALASYRRVLERNLNFKQPSAVREATIRWLRHANPLPAFLAERCIKKPDARCLLALFCRTYSDWTREMGCHLE